jgi:hypothetical protein
MVEMSGARREASPHHRSGHERDPRTRCGKFVEPTDPARIAAIFLTAICPEDQEIFRGPAGAQPAMRQHKMKSFKEQTAKLGGNLPRGVFKQKTGVLVLTGS